MKRNFIYSFTSLLILAFAFNACSKEERSPKLVVHVAESDGSAASGASVRVWPGESAGESGRIINECNYDKSDLTDSSGDVVFEFESSAVLDIDVTYYKDVMDTTVLGTDTIRVDTLTGHRVVKLEAIRQKSEENTYSETVEVK
ncbi:MAG: hypothetical protein ACPGSL_02910 [Vicingaceae bacterium]